MNPTAHTESATAANTGFKQTEVGWIPVDWEVVETGNCLTKRPDYGINAASVPYNEDLPTYLRITDISEEGQFLKNEKVSVRNSNADNYYLAEGDLVFARTGASVGKTYMYDQGDGKLVFAGFLIRVKPDSTKLIPAYLKYWTQTKYYQDWIVTNSARTGQPGINSNEFKTLQIPLPPTLTEQTAIAIALSDMDALIQAQEALLAKKRALKQGAMQELLRAKEGWVVKRLGEVCECFSGGTPNTSNPSFYGAEIPFIASGELNQKYIISTEKALTVYGLNNSSAKLVKKGTLLVAMYGATAGVSAITEIDGATNQAVLAINSSAISTKFLFNWFQLNKEYVISTYTQGGQPNLSGSLIKKIEAAMPSLEEQTRIAHILSDMDTEIEKLEAQLTKYRQVKVGMMQELLTGKKRLV